MTLFFDRNFGPLVPQALHSLGMDVTWHDQHFPPTTRDEDWLAEAGRNGWVVLTHDTQIIERAAERQALVNARVGCFVLDGGSARRWEKVMILGAAWRKIDTVISSEDPPYLWQRRPSGMWVRRRLVHR